WERWPTPRWPTATTTGTGPPWSPTTWAGWGRGCAASKTAPPTLMWLARPWHPPPGPGWCSSTPGTAVTPPDAGADLMLVPDFAQTKDQARTALRAHVRRPVSQPGQNSDGFVDAQHCTYLVQVALTALLAERGIAPDATLGHSVGEVAAAHTA